jgi:ABC-2 type transport system permease protein
MNNIIVQLRAELMLLARNGEQLLLTIIIPVMLLGFFGLVDVLPTGDMDSIDFLVPGILAVAIMSTAMVSLGIATGFERSYSVLKRLGATPLTRMQLVLAKALAVFVVELVQIVVLVPIGVALGWKPQGSTAAFAVLAVLLGSAAFAGIGLILAGTLRAEINLAAQNGLYIVLLLLGGMIIAKDSLPSVLASLSTALPSSALAEFLRSSLSGEGRLAVPGLILGVWAVCAPVIAARRFRWS